MDTDKKILVRLASVLAFLVIIFGLSFIVKRNDGKSMSVNTALLNPKYKSALSEIHISIPNDEIKDTDFTGTVEERTMLTLRKNGSIWTGETVNGSDKVIWPADSSTIENLIEYCTKLRRLYEKSSSAKNLDSLSVTEEKAKILEFITNDGQSVSRIMFGKENPLTSRISVRSSSKLNVYEIENDISLYLNAKSSFYADPYLYPVCITSFTQEEKVSLLRHGTINDSLKEKNECVNLIPVNVLRKDFADGSGVKLKVYRTFGQQENTYTVIPEYTAAISAGNEEKSAVLKMNYSYSISSWTYGKLLDETK